MEFLEENKSPTRRLGGIDNRGSHFYLAMYWAQELAAQKKDSELKVRFESLARYLSENEAKINDELIGAQNKPEDIGGYFQPDINLASEAMRPSDTLNSAFLALV